MCVCVPGCGLNQLYAMRYGTIPIAHATGGLNDTITQHNSWAEKAKDPEVRRCKLDPKLKAPGSKG